MRMRKKTLNNIVKTISKLASTIHSLSSSSPTKPNGKL